MEKYPENQIYCIVPVSEVVKLVGEVLDIARRSLDKKFIVWHYNKDNEKLKEFLKYDTVKLLSHAEALKLMATEVWQKKELNYFSSSN